MAQQTINVGTAPNDGTGTPLRTAFQYTNSNFSELYTAVGPSGNNIVVPGTATITGDLTVDTSTLKVDSANNRVGVVNASPAYPLDVVGNINTNSEVYAQGGRLALYRSAGASYVDWAYGQDLIYRTVTTVGGAGASTLMTLNSTGLGVGEAATVSKLQSRGSTSDSSAYILYGKNSVGNVICFMRNDGRFLVGNGTTDNFIVTETGNVGIGVAPSAWSSFKAIDIGTSGAAFYGSGAASGVTANAYYDGSVYRYKASQAACNYQQQIGPGIHAWFVAPSGTAGNAITFTQALTLDGSGNLLVGTTSAGGIISNATKTVGGIFSTLNGVLASIATATPTTIFAAPTDSTLIVTAYIQGAAPSDYKVVAIVKASGSALAITTISTATSMTITASGTNVQVTQTSGGTQNIYYNVIRLA